MAELFIDSERLLSLSQRMSPSQFYC